MPNPGMCPSLSIQFVVGMVLEKPPILDYSLSWFTPCGGPGLEDIRPSTLALDHRSGLSVDSLLSSKCVRPVSPSRSLRQKLILSWKYPLVLRRNRCSSDGAVSHKS